MAVDTAQGVISHIQADFADGRDSQYLPAMTVKVQNRLKANELRMTDLLADAGYSNEPNYEFLELRNITGGRRADGYLYLVCINLKERACFTIKKKISSPALWAKQSLSRASIKTPTSGF